MANPFLVLGGIAISVATAAFGILQVPGWVAAAQDASSVNDLTMLAGAQAAHLSQHGTVTSSLAALSERSGVKVSLGEPGRTAMATDPTNRFWLAVARSTSGKYFARSSENTTIGSGASPEAAVVAAGETVTGPAGSRVTGRGVPIPLGYLLSETVYRNLFANANATTVDGFAAYWGTVGRGTREVVDVTWTHSRKAVQFKRTVETSADDNTRGHFDIRPAKAKWIEPGKRYTVVFEYVGSGGYEATGQVLGHPIVTDPIARGASGSGKQVVGETPRRVWATFDFTGVDSIHPDWQAYVSADFPPGEWIELGNVDVYEGDYDPDRPWFSGNLTSDSTFDVVWTGTANNSAAIAYR